jgi:hypothetical protein
MDGLKSTFCERVFSSIHSQTPISGECRRETRYTSRFSTERGMKIDGNEHSEKHDSSMCVNRDSSSNATISGPALEKDVVLGIPTD